MRVEPGEGKLMKHLVLLGVLTLWGCGPGSPSQPPPTVEKPEDKVVEMRPADEAELLNVSDIMADDVKSAPNEIVRDEVQKRADIARCAKLDSFKTFNKWTGNAYVIEKSDDEENGIEFTVTLDHNVLGEMMTGTIPKSSSLYAKILTLRSGFSGSDVLISGTIEPHELYLADEEAKDPILIAQAISQCARRISYTVHFTEVDPL